MFKTITIATALAPALLLGACTGTQNRTLESVHQPVVSRTDYVFDVASSGNRLAPGEAQRLAGWMQTLRLGYGDVVSVDDPNAYGGRGAKDDVQQQLARYGLLLAEDAPPTAGAIAPGSVRVVVSRMRASVPGCPDYSRVSGIEYESNTSSNHGCSTNSNLASMIASPTDLVRGQPGADVPDAYTATKAIDTYRKSAPAAGGGAAKGGN